MRPRMITGKGSQGRERGGGGSIGSIKQYLLRHSGGVEVDGRSRHPLDHRQLLVHRHGDHDGDAVGRHAPGPLLGHSGALEDLHRHLPCTHVTRTND